MGGRASPTITCEEAQPPESRAIPINGRPMRPFIWLSWNLRYWPGYPQTAQDMSPRITDTGCPKGTPQGHALATLINKFSWRRDCRESYTTRRCACSVRWSTTGGAAPMGDGGPPARGAPLLVQGPEMKRSSRFTWRCMKLRLPPGLPRVPNKERYDRREGTPHDGVRLARLLRARSCGCFGNIVAAFRVRHQSHFSALRFPDESPISADMRRQIRSYPP